MITFIVLLCLLAFGLFCAASLFSVGYIALLVTSNMDKDQERTAKYNADMELKAARTAKVRRDHEVLESRQALIDSDVAIRELRINKMRREAGQDFEPDNYK